MAQAAIDAVWWAGWQTIVGIAGFIAVVFSLFFTGWAAVAASRAAKATAETADAMMDAERPHMLASEIKVSGLHNRPAENGKVSIDVTYKFTNYGKSPALLKGITIEYECAELSPIPKYGELHQLRFITTEKGWYGSIKPVTIILDGITIADIFLGTTNICIFGILEYEDPFGKSHRNRFCYRLVTDGGPESIQFRPDGPDSYHEYT